MSLNSMSGATYDFRKYFLAKNFKKDLPSSVVVFLVALPLCLGIALASGAPLFSGILTGIIGGVIVASFSGSQLSVSGPAAGLTVIVLNAITGLGSFEAFLLAVFLAGILQIILGMVRAGTIASYFPSSVIEGMLAAIGIILILKQIPHAVGFDADFGGSESFLQKDGGNTISALGSALKAINPGAVIISLVSLGILIYWPRVKKLSIVPAALLVVVAGVLFGLAFRDTSLALTPGLLVTVPVVHSFGEFTDLFLSPDFGRITDQTVWVTAVTIAIVASLETLLSLEAVDKIDPIKRVSPTNRELVAQGIGNMTSGLLGGLPLTAVIVRSSANVNAGARTKMSAIYHGMWLLLSFLFIPFIINLIPLSCLAAILLVTGYKLARIALFRKMWRNGKDQFIPFVTTVIAVVFTDLLTGVGIGMAVGVFYVLRTNLRNPYFYRIERVGTQKVIRIRLAEEVSFLNKAAIQYTLTHLPAESTVIIDGRRSRYIDQDVLEIIRNFRHHATTKGIIVILEEVKESYQVPRLEELVYKPEKVM